LIWHWDFDFGLGKYKYFFWGEEMIIISIIIFPVEIRKILNRVVVDRKAKSTLLFLFLKLKRKKKLVSSSSSLVRNFCIF
jgi:hypothetical protein